MHSADLWLARCDEKYSVQFRIIRIIVFQLSNFSNALDLLALDKSVRVLIIRSLLPHVFCAGADLKERATMTPIEVQRFVTSLRAILKNVEQLPIPVISAIDGAALGGGLEMALACDIRTVSNDAKLGEQLAKCSARLLLN